MIFKKLWFFCFIIPVSFNIDAASLEDVPMIILDNEMKDIYPGNKTLLYEDKSGLLGLNEIRKKLTSFKPNHGKLINAGSTSSAYWCVIRVRNNTQEKWYIEIGEPYLDFIDFYSISQNGRIEVVKTGLQRDFKERSIKVNHFIIPLDIAFGEEKIYYIRAQSYTILKLPMVISTIQNHFEVNHKEDIWNGIYFGLVVALSLYNLFVFLLLKDKTYLYYVLYINFLGITTTWLRGYTPEFLNVLSPNIIHGNNFAALAFVFLSFFTHSFLNLNIIAPKHRFIKAAFVVISSVTIITTLTGYYYVSFVFIMFIVSINLPYIAFFGIYALKKGFRPAIYYLLGFTFFTLGDFIFIISENAKIQQTLLGDYSLQIGSSIEAIILSFALANKLNLYKKEKEETQAKALAQANEFSKALIKTQEEERKRIAGELHDSVGQSLSMLKNRIALLKKNKKIAPSLDELNDTVTSTIQEIRSITYGLRPFQLDLLGLTQSLKSLIEDVAQSGEVKFSIKIDNIDGLLAKDAEINVFRILQECLSNISRHSQANEAKVEINNNGRIEILVEDNGIGLNHPVKGHGFGIIGIKERVHILNGNLEITGNQPNGTKVHIYI